MVVITTAADGMLEALKKEKDKRLPLNKLAKKLKVDVPTIERWAGFMPEIVAVEYPTNVLSRPFIRLLKQPKPSGEKKRPSGEVLSSYRITADKVSAEVSIVKNKYDLVPLYHIVMPELGPVTDAIVDGLANDLTKKVPITIEDISDQRRMAQLKDVFEAQAKEIINKEFEKEIKKNKDLADTLAGILLHNCYGLGTMEILMRDDMLEEIVVNSSHTPLGAYHIKFGWVRTNVFLPSEKEIYNLAAQIARKAGTNITNLTPLMDAHLISGDRANSTLFPISSFGNTVTIRKFARVPWTLISFLKPENNTLSYEIAALLWLCMQYELNVLVTGGTASGKTSMLNAICALIPGNHRIVSIEETRELNLPEYLHWNWIPTATRNANPEGKGEVTMLDLITNSLRMRPDRIIMGEVRRKEEAEVLFEAMHTGHSVYSTVHADTSRHLVRRMSKPPFDLPIEDIESLDLIVVQFRDRKRGFRRTLEVAEVLQSNEDQININYLYRWNPRSDAFEQVNESRHLFEKLNLYTGMTNEEIKRDLADKVKILKWMVKNDMTDIEKVGATVADYYKDRNALMQKMAGVKKKPPAVKKPVVKKTVKGTKKK